MGTFFASTSVGFPGGSIFSDASAVNLQADSTATSGLKLGTSGSTPVVFYSNGAERMRVDAAGNVGIGTASPVEKLEIGINDGITKAIKILHSTVPGYITSGFDGTFAYTCLSTNSRPNDATYTTPGNPAYGNLFFSQKAMPSTLSRFVFSSAPATAGTPVVTDLMTILQTGEVGIGTATPNALLSVNGVASFGAGTAALPSIAAFGDLDTGLWFPGVDTVAVSTGGG